MSIAVTSDKHIILGTDGAAGHLSLRFVAAQALARPESGTISTPRLLAGAKVPTADERADEHEPLLPGDGGVAADPHGPRWAAAQAPDRVCVFRGEKLEKRLQLPEGHTLYGVGLLCFSPDGELCVTAHEDGRPADEVSFMMLNVERDDARRLFVWTKEHVNDFVIGPPMPGTRAGRRIGAHIDLRS